VDISLPSTPRTIIEGCGGVRRINSETVERGE
jgi:hypothetical protein